MSEKLVFQAVMGFFIVQSLATLIAIGYVMLL